MARDRDDSRSKLYEILIIRILNILSFQKMNIHIRDGPTPHYQIMRLFILAKPKFIIVIHILSITNLMNKLVETQLSRPA